MEHSNVRFLFTNAVNNSRGVSYTLVEKLSSFQFLNISDEIWGVDIINGTSKCRKTFVDKCCKQQSLCGLYLRRKAKFSVFQKKFVVSASIINI